jgi:hypothetical protein
VQNKTPPPGATAGEGVELQIKHPCPAISNSTSSSLQFPTGLVGEIAEFIFSASPRPVREIALVAATGLLAGITGRAFNISGTGLNQYILLIAKTGRGKEAIAGGISKLMKAVKARVPAAMEFEGPTEIASPQAITKWLARSPCIFSIVGEFGIKLEEMSAAKAPPNISGLKRTLLDLYHKSGNNAVLGAMAYARREDNTPVINSPSFTLIGETTPETLFENINGSIVASGLLSRFSTVEYDGPRVPLFKAHNEAVPSDGLITALAALCAQCVSVGSTGLVVNVSIDPIADAIFDRFNEFCDAQINSSDEGVVSRELWNRAHLKALKLAALHAVGCNYLSPRVEVAQAQAACDEIHAQTTRLLAHFARGDMGAVEDNESLRRRAVIKAVLHYATTKFEQLPKFGAREDMHRKRVITLSYLNRCLCDTAPFRKAYGGATKALATTVKNMFEADELQEINHQQKREEFHTTARAFVITNALAFLAPDEY